MNDANKLTLEQEFKLAIYTKKVYRLSNKNIKMYLIETLKQMMIKDNIIKYFIKNSMS
uniref:phycobilisome degradation protein n=1 Tax=Gloiopeltis furcata TaxID=42017 RepID=UPI0028D4A757|nr:phycobilisome degradation protein [Gloiopeltis furcata]WMP13857.1 phycobilisome degradation protein [Gloiopeltis furcata]